MTFDVELERAPDAGNTATVSLTLSGTDAANAISLSDTSLQFNSGNYNTPQTVTVTGSEDDDAVDDNRHGQPGTFWFW